MHYLVLVLLLFIDLYHLNYSFESSINIRSNDYIPLFYPSTKRLFISNPCQTRNPSILIRNHSLYQFDRDDRQWKQVFISEKLFPKQMAVVQSIVYLNDDWIFIINGQLCRTQDFIRSISDQTIIYRLIRYFNAKLERIDYAFATPCCSCSRMANLQLISETFNQMIILANQAGNITLINIQSLKIVYDFGNLFQHLPICQSNRCRIQYLGFIHSQPSLFCVIEYQPGKSVLFHQSFSNENSTNEKFNYLNFTGDSLYIMPSTIPDAYFLWDDRKIFYTSNAGSSLWEIRSNGCEKLDFHIDQHNFTTDIFCFNLTIESIVLFKQEFLIATKDQGWFYGRESFFPSIISASSSCISSEYLPEIDPQCLFNDSYPCSAFVQSTCSYTRFQALFDLNQIYHMDKIEQKTWQFILETYAFIPIVISSSKSNLFRYLVNYQINSLNNGTIRILGTITVTMADQTNQTPIGSSVISLRVELLQYGYACTDMPSFSFQIEASCSTKSQLQLNKTDEINRWNSPKETDWFRENLPSDLYHQFSPIYIKRKQIDPIFLHYRYCLNDTCQTINRTSFLVYAIPFDRKYEDSARYFFQRTDDCIPMNRLISRLWLKWTWNRTIRTQFSQIPYERRTFYQVLLNLLVVSSNSCLFFNTLNPIEINQTFFGNDESVKFLVHIIAYENSFSFCDLETFFIVEIASSYPSTRLSRGWLFFSTILLFLILFLLIIHLYTYYKNFQRDRLIEYHRLNQIDAGQLHQWYDIARYLNTMKNSESYYSMQNYLSNLEPRKP